MADNNSTPPVDGVAVVAASGLAEGENDGERRPPAFRALNLAAERDRDDGERRRGDDGERRRRRRVELLPPSVGDRDRDLSRRRRCRWDDNERDCVRRRRRCRLVLLLVSLRFGGRGRGAKGDLDRARRRWAAAVVVLSFCWRCWARGKDPFGGVGRGCARLWFVSVRWSKCPASSPLNE